MLNNQGDALARRMDMSVNASAFPCQFVQQLFQSPLNGGTATGTEQTISLTGFKAGEVKEIHIWLTDAANTNVGSGVNNPNWWYLPSKVVMTYAGDIYARYESKSSQIWNLINGNKANYVVSQGFTGGGSNALSAAVSAPVSAANTASPVSLGAPGSQWVVLPFAQTCVDEDSHYTLVHGKPITNGIVQLQLTPPYSAVWTLNVSYVLNSTLLMSMGTADFVF